MDKGWISIHRQIRDCDLLWDDKPFSRGQAWIDLLLLANHEDKRIIFDGKVCEVKRGQRITSYRVLSREWGWSNTKVANFLDVLEQEQMIVKKSDTKKTLITIVNYDKFQNIDLEKRHQNDTETTQKRRNNNDNNYNNNITPLTPLTGEKENSHYDFSKNSNVDNVKHILNNKEYEEWEYIKNNPDLWSCIKEWMEYKDLRKPKASNHYVSPRSMKIILNDFVNHSKEYGVPAVVEVVNKSIGNTYAGILWDNLTKPATSKTDWSVLH